ncbi:Metallo-dependent phosphatase-like protein [Aspergillus aurantiobrunneus]
MVTMQSDEIQFVHFNDIYHIPSAALLTGFLNLQREFAASNPSAETLTLFSGDAFSPSLEASVLKGEQILPLLDIVGIDIGCYGNHDFDFGHARLIELSSRLKFPWLLSNASHLPAGDQKRTLGSAREYIVRQLENGLRVGFIGLAGTDWPSNCERLPPCEIESPVQAACRLAHHLRVNERCDLVIALTHMRVPEDMAVANATVSGDSRIDLLLGGHDHDVLRRFAGDTDTIAGNAEQGRRITKVEVDGRIPDVEGDIRLVKSGTDWRALSLIRLIVQRDEKGIVIGSTVKLRQYTDIQAAMAAPQPPSNIIEMLEGIHDRVGKLVQKPLLHSAVPMDGLNSTLRSQETNMGNMLADVIRAFYKTDVGIFNSGGIRSDQILKATVPDGEPLRARDIINICPFGNGLLVKQLTGEIIRLALENSVSDMHTDGRFLQISGLRMLASWHRPEWSRVVDVLFERPDGSLEPLDPVRTYTVAMPAFIAQGYDGFTWFAQMETIVGEEAAMTDAGLLLAIFGHDEESSEGGDPKNNAHAMGIERARALTVVGRNPSDSLPIVEPVVEDRIRFVEA